MSQISASFLVISAILSTIVIGTIIGNVFVIVAILIDKNLQTTANQLVLSLAVADLMVACLVMPLGAYNDLYQGWFLGKEVCEFWTSADVLCCTASILNLLAIALDRYWAVTSADYIYKRTRRRVNMMILYAWTVGAIVSLAPIFGWKDPDFAQRVLVEHKCMVSQDVAYQIFATISTFYAPLVLLLALYWRIFKVARKRIRRKPGRNEQSLAMGSSNNNKEQTGSGLALAGNGQLKRDTNKQEKERISSGDKMAPACGANSSDRLAPHSIRGKFQVELSNPEIGNNKLLLLMRRLAGGLAPYRWLWACRNDADETRNTRQDVSSATTKVIEWVQTTSPDLNGPEGPPQAPIPQASFAGQAPEEINERKDSTSGSGGWKAAGCGKVHPLPLPLPGEPLEAARLSDQIEGLLRLVGGQTPPAGSGELKGEPASCQCQFCCCCCTSCGRMYRNGCQLSLLTGGTFEKAATQINHAGQAGQLAAGAKDKVACGCQTKTLAEDINNKGPAGSGSEGTRTLEPSEISALNNLCHLSKRFLEASSSSGGARLSGSSGGGEDSRPEGGVECSDVSGESGSASSESLCCQAHSCPHSAAEASPRSPAKDDIIIVGSRPTPIKAADRQPPGRGGVAAEVEVSPEALASPTEDNDDDKQHGPGLDTGPPDEPEYINDEEEEDQSDASLSAAFPPPLPKVKQVKQQEKLPAGRDFFSSCRPFSADGLGGGGGREGGEINNIGALAPLPPTTRNKKRGTKEDVPPESRGNKEMEGWKNCAGGGEFIALDRRLAPVCQEELAKRQKRYGIYSTAPAESNRPPAFQDSRKLPPLAFEQPTNNENLEDKLVFSRSRPLSYSVSNPPSFPSTGQFASQILDDQQETTANKGLVNLLPEQVAKGSRQVQRQSLIVANCQFGKGEEKLAANCKLNQLIQQAQTGAPAGLRNAPMRSLDIRRKFRALGQLVSFVATNKGLNSSEGSSGSRPSLTDELPGEEAGHSTWQLNKRLDYSNETNNCQPAGSSDACRQTGSGAREQAASSNNSDKKCEISTIEKLSSSMPKSGQIANQFATEKQPISPKSIESKPLVVSQASGNQLAGSSSPQPPPPTAASGRRRQRENLEIKREKKAAKTLAIITGVFVCCWLPFFLNAIVMPICGPLCTPSDLVLSILLWLGYLNSLLNPIIYTIFSPDFRRAFRRLLCWPELVAAGRK